MGLYILIAPSENLRHSCQQGLISYLILTEVNLVRGGRLGKCLITVHSGNLDLNVALCCLCP